MKTKAIKMGLIAAGVMVSCSTINAGSVFFTGTGTSTSGQGISAAATFEADGSTLRITLENTWLGAGGTKDDASTLVGMFFSGLDNLSLSGATAFVPAGAEAWAGTSGTVIGAGGLNVGGEWGYQTFGSAINGATAGLSSSGLSGLFNNANLNGPDLDNQLALNGVDYGIVSENYDASLANNGVKKTTTIKNSTVFTFKYAGNLENLANIQFAYGTLPNSYLSGVKNESANLAVNIPDSGNTLLLFGSIFVVAGLAGRKKALLQSEPQQA